MSILDNNMDFLKSKLPGIYNIIIEEQPINTVQINKIDNMRNYQVACNNVKVYINSLYDTDREMKEMFKNVKSNTKKMVVFGFGCGYAADYINKNFKNIENVYYIEPSLQFFTNVLEEYNLQKMFNEGQKNVTFIINQKEDFIVSFLQQLFFEDQNIDIVYHVSYFNLFTEEFQYITKTISDVVRKNYINLSTATQVNYTWPYNIFSNLTVDRVLLNELSDAMEGMTGIIVSAGPSLEKNMHLLSEFKNKAIIVAVGTAINILENNGIKPHFRMAIDGNPTEKNIFDNIDTGTTPIIYASSLEKRILPEYSGKKIEFLLDADKLTGYIYKKSSILCNTVKSGFSIANVAFDFFGEMKFKQVIFVGQDLCYTNDKLYAKGSWENSKVDSEKKGFVKTENLFGEEVYTTPQFLGMKTIFEQLIALYPKIEVYNATEGGLNINGAKNVKLADMLLLEDNCEKIDSLFNLVNKKSDFAAMHNKIDYVILSIEKDNQVISKYMNELLKYLKKINRYKINGMKANKILNEIHYIEDYENKLVENSFYNDVVKQVLESILKAIENNFYYNGEDKIKLYESREKIMFRKILEIIKYSNMIDECVKSYKTLRNL